MLNAAMRVLSWPVSDEMIENGGLPVKGKIRHDRRSNKCRLEVEA
jgi:hypothetical protein